jgi:molybdopterin/thiamine biosynthesis adenylyltransferase
MSKVLESRSRFSSIEWAGQTREITVGGVGTIGSNIAIPLARSAEHTILLYDDDIIDIVNLSGQMFSLKALGKHKAIVVRDLMLSFTEISDRNVHVFTSRIEDGTYVSPVCFSCFDNMKARKAMFNNWKKLDNKEIFIDGRMTIESYEVYSVTPDMIEQYEETLFSDEDVPDQICSLKNTTHTGFLIAGRMMSAFTNHLANVATGIPMREVPFKFREDMVLQRIEML